MRWNKFRKERDDINITQFEGNYTLKIDIDKFIEGFFFIMQDIKENGVYEPNEQTMLNSLPERIDLDFMDQFWILVQPITSHVGLTDALTAIIEELEQARLFPMVI
jgi:hypothetical protein